ncbi:MAG: response regulator [Deltaproteobacteria bacterium]|nr:response regulator [Deltaproteobacteria bacterium]
MKILVAEDEPMSRELLENMLTKFGYECIPAADGQEAWELLNKHALRMVITDWSMPNVDGLNLCRKIRSGKFHNYVYVILLTAKGDNNDTVAGFEAGIDDYMIKPFDPKVLKARVTVGERIIHLEDDYKKAQAQLLQSEKMASVGQLAAGVAHEINNPTGYISSNLKTLADYEDDIRKVLDAYHQLVETLRKIPADSRPAALTEQLDRVAALEKELDIAFVMDDLRDLTRECQDGTERIKKIILDLKDFAHPGNDKIQEADINKGIESTLNVVWNELKYKATVTKNLGDLPPVKCLPQQLNQVFMNLLVNAAQAIKEKGEIAITTQAVNGYVEIKISDTGCGIPPENLNKVFDPFFTTKEVGSGTGLGLNVSYNIIKKHNGSIAVESQVGKGTTFTIRLPVS